MIAPTAPRYQQYLASLVGNVLEWYDFVLYGMFATVFSKLFFNPNNPHAALFGALSIFAVGYLMRPIGGIIIGHFGDTRSRRRALVFSLLTMGVVTTLIGCLPTYQSLGIGAPLLLLLLRLVQGFAVGGEFPGSMIVLRDLARKQSPAFTTALSVTGAMGGFLLGSGFATLLAHSLSQTAFETWGWRIPFLCGFLLALLGLYIRLKVWRQEPNTRQRNVPIAQLWRHYKRNTLIAMAQVFLTAVFTAMGSIFLVAYLNHYLHYPLDQTLLLLFISTAIQMITIPLSARLADRLRRYHTYAKWNYAIIFITMLPLFHWMQQGGDATIAAVLLFMLIFSFGIGQTTYLVVELFPAPVRYTGVALSHGVVMSLTVGLTPLVMNALLLRWGLTAPAYVLMFAAALAWFSLTQLNDTNTGDKK